MRTAVSRAAWACVCAVIAVATTNPADANAQVAKTAGDVRSVEGRVRRPIGHADSTDMGPAINTWVTVHRVGKDSAGPVDSVRSDALGRYRMTWRTFGTADAVYFASVTWSGIAYFTPPLRDRDTRGEGAEITVFDTTSATFPLHVKGRHLIVSSADSSDMRTVIEVFELENDSLRTLVASAAKPSPTWTVRIPALAQDVHASAGEISPDAFTMSRGRVAVFAPIAPGVKQVSFSYRIPSSGFPFTLGIDEPTVVFEVLLEDAQATARGAGVIAVGPVSMENRSFRRFLAQDVGGGATVVIDVPDGRGIPRRYFIAGLLVVIGGVMLAALAHALRARVDETNTAAPYVVRADEMSESERLAQEIAMLDASHANRTAKPQGDNASYAVRRAALKAALHDALAAARAQD